LPPHYFHVAQGCNQVWDYSERNAAEWAKRGIAAKVVPIGYVPELRKITPAARPDIDVLFYGSRNSRRRQVLAQIQDCGLSISTLFGEYGALRDGRIARAKVALNLHFYEAKLFEIVRVSYLMANGIAVVTEESPDIPDDLRPGLAIAPYEKLAETCKALIAEPDRREELGRKAFECFSQHSESDILRKALLVLREETRPTSLDFLGGSDAL
jgi:hypothetical protein